MNEKLTQNSVNNQQTMESTELMDPSLKVKCLKPVLRALLGENKAYTDDALNTVAANVNMSPTEVLFILLESQPSTNLSWEARLQLLNHVKAFYLSLQRPLNFQGLFDIVKKDIMMTNCFPDFNSFMSEMKALKYEIVQISPTLEIIMENPKIKHERHMFLKKINEFRRHKKSIVYVDERIISQERVFKKPMKLELEEHESVIFMAACKTGIITCLMTNQCAEFHKWIIDVVLQQLPSKNSVILLDRNPIHNDKPHKTKITRYHSKAAMLKWLTTHNIPHDEVFMPKPELYELVKNAQRYCENEGQSIDKILRSYGFEVLRLPHTFEDLTIIECFWKEVRKKMQQHSIEEDTTQILTDIINNIKDDGGPWKQFNHLVEQYESYLHSVDAGIDFVLEKYLNLA